LRKDIRIGDYVKVERAGDVIPHVVSVDITKRNKKVISFVFPKKCPSCGSKVSKDFNTVTKKFEAVTRCTSEGYECEKMSIEKIKHFISKDALNIDGFGKKVVENFWNLKFIRYPYQIYELDFKKIENLDGWGKLSVSNLMYSIEKSKKVSLDKLIFALGIRHIGQENAKLISEYLKTIDNLEKIDNTYNFSVFLNIDGIGETQVKSIKNFFSNKANLKIIKKLKNYLNVAKMQINKSGKLNNNTFLITGKLNGISRAEAKSKIEQLSGKIQSSVNKNLNFLVIGDKPTLKKVNKAKEFNITLLDQEKFLKLIN